jgi:hypothetical protein
MLRIKKLFIFPKNIPNRSQLFRKKFENDSEKTLDIKIRKAMAMNALRCIPWLCFIHIKYRQIIMMRRHMMAISCSDFLILMTLK